MKKQTLDYKINIDLPEPASDKLFIVDPMVAQIGSLLGRFDLVIADNRPLLPQEDNIKLGEKFFSSGFISWKEDPPDALKKEGIPIVSVKEIVAPIYSHFNLTLKDNDIIFKACDYLTNLVNTNDRQKIRCYFFDPLINYFTLNLAVIYCFNDANDFIVHELRSTSIRGEGVEIERPINKWIEAQGNLIKSLAKSSYEDDIHLQNWLNYHDFILWLGSTPKGREILLNIFDLRGLDFFLIHYYGGRTVAVADSSLFTHARIIPDSLRIIGREEEALKIEGDLLLREKSRTEIKNTLKKTDPQNDSKRLRIIAEKYWIDYLGLTVWQRLDDESRVELRNAFVIELNLTEGVLKGWYQVAFILCKVVEREMGITFFSPWKELIANSDFADIKTMPSTQQREMKKYYGTYVKVKNAASGDKIPTLGELINFIQLWYKDLPKQYTALFFNIRNELHPDLNYQKKLQELVTNIQLKKQINGKSANILVLRNKSVHPGQENLFEWKGYSGWLKESIGKPPVSLLFNIVIELRYPPLKMLEEMSSVESLDHDPQFRIALDLFKL